MPADYLRIADIRKRASPLQQILKLAEWEPVTVILTCLRSGQRTEAMKQTSIFRQRDQSSSVVIHCYTLRISS